MRVLFTTAPLFGHFSPLVPLAWACRAAGHDVLMVTSEHFVPTVRAAGLAASSAGQGMGVGELASTDPANGIDDDRYAHGVVFAEMAARNLAETCAIVRTWQPDIVVSERAELSGPIAAAMHRLPLVEFQWGVPELAEYRAAADMVLRAELVRLGLPGLPQPDVILNPWPSRLRMPHAHGHIGVRHVPYEGGVSIAGWMLDTGGAPRVCVTLGTVIPRVAPVTMSLLAATTETLMGQGWDVVIAVDDDLAAILRPSLPADVLHCGRVALSQMVRTSSVLVHHGGQGTSLTSLAAGCPQVVLPKFDDQFDNSAAVARSGAGLCLPLDEATPDVVAGMCARVRDDAVFAHGASGVAVEIGRQPAPAERVDVLERVARRPHGTTSGAAA